MKVFVGPLAGKFLYTVYNVTMGATAVLVLQDGRPIQVVLRDFLGTEMRMYCLAIAQVE